MKTYVIRGDSTILFNCPHCRIRLAKAEGSKLVCTVCKYETTSEITRPAASGSASK